jgi:hypothetical protein
MTMDPSSIRPAGDALEIRVDGKDIVDEDCDGERKTGAHVVVLVPRSDFSREANGRVVVLLKKSEFRRNGSSWRSRGRLAFQAR